MPKICTAPGCTQNVWGKGYCRSHQYMRPPKEVRTPKDRGLFVREQDPDSDAYEKALNAWFKLREKDIVDSGNVCWECGSNIPKQITRYTSEKTHNVSIYRSVTAHIIPKSIFPSVATHPLNFLILGVSCGCHGRFDHSIDRARKMKVFNEALERARIIIPHIKENHEYLTMIKELINTMEPVPLISE